MPNLSNIRGEIVSKPSASDSTRRKYLKKLHQLTGRDTILLASAFSPAKIGSNNLPQSVISISTDDIQGFMSALYGLTGSELDLILHSPGGTLEAADQIVQYLRSKYKHIRAIVPQNAMSAATMIACACDEIVMGKHSAIGPIDPQITLPTENGYFTAPAQAIMDELKRAEENVTRNPAMNAIWATKIKTYPAGIFNICEETLLVSKKKVEDWLSTYMLKDDPKKAKEIAEWLGDFKVHKTHGRPIGPELATEKGLKVIRLEDNQEFQEAVLSLFHALIATFELSNCTKLIENHNGKGRFLNLSAN